MKLSKLCDEDLQKVAMLKNRKGCATSDALRAQEILYARNITKGFVCDDSDEIPARYFANTAVERDCKTFEELHGCTLEEYLKRRRKRES